MKGDFVDDVGAGNHAIWRIEMGCERMLTAIKVWTWGMRLFC